MNLEIEKARREQNRWLILSTLNAARPIGANERLILSVIRDVIDDLTAHELRRELHYLEERELVYVVRPEGGLWNASLTRGGIDLVEYTCECEPGIARPPKYWRNDA